jgi:Domain of unknown function (DUF5615)
MKLLLDECVTRHLKRDLTGHEVHTVEEAGFKGLENGDLLKAASGVYEVLITVDQNLPIGHGPACASRIQPLDDPIVEVNQFSFGKPFNVDPHYFSRSHRKIAAVKIQSCWEPSPFGQS